MRYNGIDESKIIKKNSTKQKIEDKVESINRETIKVNTTIKEENIINLANQTNEIITSSIKTKETINNTIEQEETLSYKSNNVFPVFKYEQNLQTGKVEVRNVPTKTNINLKIPKDQLKIIQINNDKYILEIKLELEVLKSLLNQQDSNHNFYKDKYEYLSKELIFLERKQLIINKMLL